MTAHLYTGMSFADYLKIDAINSHAIMAGCHPQTIRHMAAYMQQCGEEDKRDWKLGRAIHSKILEPDTFHKDWRLSLPCDGIYGKDSKRAGQKCGKYATRFDGSRWLCGIHCGDTPEIRDVIDQGELARVLAVERELHEAGQLAQFRRRGWSECVITFELIGYRNQGLDENGKRKPPLPVPIKCKARLDRLPEDKSMVIDFKKVRPGRANLEAFRNQVAEYQYHVQAWFYCEAVRAISGAYPSFTWVICEDDVPHCVNVVMASNFDLKVGRHLGQSVLNQLTNLEPGSTGTGYIDGNRVAVGALPQWYANRFQRIELGDDFAAESNLPF